MRASRARARGHSCQSSQLRTDRQLEPGSRALARLQGQRPPRSLGEDAGENRSNATTLFNLQTGYKFTRDIRLALDVFNLFDAEDSDIDYFYNSRLPGEPDEGVEDIHFHPALPRTARLNLIVSF